MVFLSKHVLFGHIFKKSAHLLLVHGHSPWSMFNLRLVRGPKALKYVFVRNLTMEL